MKDTSVYDWNKNSYWLELTSEVKKMAQPFSDKPVVYDPELRSWKQECSAAGAGKLLMLQNQFMAVDVTDRGLGIVPLQMTGRYYAKLSFRIEEGGNVYYTHLENNSFTDNGSNRYSIFEAGSHVLCGSLGSRLRYKVRTVLPPSFPFIVIELLLSTIGNDCTVKVTPELTWMPGQSELMHDIGGVWLRPQHVAHAYPFLAQNHSVTADPPRLPGGIPAGIGVVVIETIPSSDSTSKATINSESTSTLGDREFDSLELTKCLFDEVSVKVKSGQSSKIGCLLGIASDKSRYEEDYRRWCQLDYRHLTDEMNYWPAVSKRFNISCPDKQITNQAKYSVHNSLFSRSKTPEGLTFFVHGRPDRGYGDCAKLHQSYQMHYVALAAGETDSVREELLAYASLQNVRGDIAKQLSPSTTEHPYAGMYSNAHFIMALHRYLSWTGDIALLDEMPENLRGSSHYLTMLERAKLAAEWLLENRWQGLIAPCGWLDAWPPEVRGQAQISITSYMAFRDLAAICGHVRDDEGKLRYEKEAEALKSRIMDVFYDEKTGLFAEHLFESGEVTGSTIEDFWAHTQIWAALADLAPDTRGLEACRQHCLSNGMVVIPESSLFSDYIDKSTDGVEDLSFGFTATWLLARWPEVTHLYALAELRYGRVNEALEAVHGQLPEQLNAMNPEVSPYFYPEKYLHPGHTPWLCTWSGDPTLLQVLLEGFSGVKVNLDGIEVHPQLPELWSGDDCLRTKFQLRGQEAALVIDSKTSTIKAFHFDHKLVGENRLNFSGGEKRGS
jgi:hypothetical protein